MKNKINNNNIAKGVFVGALIFSFIFLSWYYFVVKMPQDKHMESGLLSSQDIKDKMIESGYTEEEVNSIFTDIGWE